MFSRLWQWALPRTARERHDPASPDAPRDAARAKSMPVVSERPAPVPPPPPAPHLSIPVEVELEALPEQDDWLSEISAALPSCEPLTDEDEARVVALVMQAVEYVARKKVEPPVMPALVPRVLAITGEPEVDVARLTKVIEQDLALSAKLLSVANSPAFGGNVELRTVRKAVGHLGTEQVAQVAIGLACRSSFDAASDSTPLLRARWSRLFEHGMTSAFGASHIAAKCRRGSQEQAFLGGLFHDVGKAVALRAIEALHKRGALEEPSPRVLDEALQRIHAYPGEEFYAQWTLPEGLLAICAQHHQLEEVPDAASELYCVSLASSFDSLLRGGPVEQREAIPELRHSAERLALGDDALRALYEQTRLLGERSTRMLG